MTKCKHCSITIRLINQQWWHSTNEAAYRYCQPPTRGTVAEK